MDFADPLFWLAAVILIPLTAIAVKIGLIFDLTKHIEGRHEREKEKLRILCPHAQIGEENGAILIIPLYISPPGTHQWRCEQCGSVVNDPSLFDRAIREYEKNPDLLVRAENRLQKQAKKVYKL